MKFNRVRSTYIVILELDQSYRDSKDWLEAPCRHLLELQESQLVNGYKPLAHSPVHVFVVGNEFYLEDNGYVIYVLIRGCHLHFL